MGSRTVNTNQPRHPTWSLSFRERAQLPNTPALAVYLLHLIAIKKSNLCLSADVSTSAELLKLADETGDSICILKTHADIVDDWSERTVRKLREIAKKKKFLVFEDRKFGDIGSMAHRCNTKKNINNKFRHGSAAVHFGSVWNRQVGRDRERPYLSRSFCRDST